MDEPTPAHDHAPGRPQRERPVRRLAPLQAFGVMTLLLAVVGALAFVDRPAHTTDIDRANLELAEALAEHEATSEQWMAARDVQGTLSTRGTLGGASGGGSALAGPGPGLDLEARQAELGDERSRAMRTASQAEVDARQSLGRTEGVSRADLLLEQVLTLVQPPHTHPEPPLGWPVEGAVVSGFGLRAWPDFGHMHPGIDIVNLPGTPIAAAADGVVVTVRSDRHGGNAVVVDHGHIEAHPGRWTTVYGHLDEITVVERERVAAGDQIGTLGNTGQQSTGPHLHFEVRIEDQPVDPRRWLP